MNEKEERLRQHPDERFAGQAHVFDLSRALNDLRAESHPARHGHRQVTIFHRGPVTKALFAFEPGGELADHAAKGLVTIHALEGRLKVQAADEAYNLNPGMMVVLSPNVRHSVRADEASAMLLTVHLQADTKPVPEPAV
jgi:quercetin dioxygenase-like cupin family protein